MHLNLVEYLDLKYKYYRIKCKMTTRLAIVPSTHQAPQAFHSDLHNIYRQLHSH